MQVRVSCPSQDQPFGEEELQQHQVAHRQCEQHDDCHMSCLRCTLHLPFTCTTPSKTTFGVGENLAPGAHITFSHLS